MKKKLLLFAVILFMFTAFAPKAVNAAGQTTGQTTFMAQAKAKNRKISYSWTKVAGAVKYKVYQTTCGKVKFKRVKVTKATGYTARGLKAGVAYKAYVEAFDKNGKKIAASPCIHARTKGKKKLKDSNATKVTAAAGLALTVKQTGNVNAVIAAKDGKKPVMVDNHAPRMRYYSTDKTIASVSKTGLVTANAAGTAMIYSVAPTGVYAKTVVTVTAAAASSPAVTPAVPVTDPSKTVKFIRKYTGDSGTSSAGMTLKLKENTFGELITSGDNGTALPILDDIADDTTKSMPADQLADLLDNLVKSGFMLGYDVSVSDFEDKYNTNLTIYYKFCDASKVDGFQKSTDQLPTYWAGSETISKEDAADSIAIIFYVVYNGEQIPVYPVDYSSQTIAYLLKDTTTGNIVKKSDPITSGMELELTDLGVTGKILIRDPS